MPQTTYNLDNLAAVAGQIVTADTTESIVGRYTASEEIAPGLMTELHTDGKLRVYRGGKKVGIATYRDAKEPGAWQVDDYVPVLRRGTIWAQCATSPGADLTEANVSYKDTTATDRGKLTSAAPSNGADAQVYDGGPMRFINDTSPTVTGLALVECDFRAEKEFAPSAPAPTLVSQSSNNYAINPANEAVYEINTTAANSTVSFDPTAPNGTSCMVVADGVKNGHTLTFRDGTTVISAATTASKRVCAIAVKAGGAWTVAVTVGP